MSDKIDDAGPAFPVANVNLRYGMSLRDWFAGMALSGFCSNASWSGISQDIIAESAYIKADAMIEARKKERV